MRIYICCGCGYFGQGDRCGSCGSDDVSWTELSARGEQLWEDTVIGEHEKEDLQDAASVLEADISIKNNEIYSLEEENSDLRGRVEELEVEKEELKEKIQEWKEEYKKLEQKTEPTERARKDKLLELSGQEGFSTPRDMVDKFALSSVVPGICKSLYCEYSTQVEPDQRAGWCEECENQTVVSCLVLAGIM